MSLKPIVESPTRHDSLSRVFVTPAGTFSFAHLGRQAISFLASLKLTVGLMIAAVIVILTFTFQLTRMDIWQAKSEHFPSLYVYISLQTFFPPKWFPDWQSVPGGFYMPSGFLILSLMLVNLFAAHLTRFRITGTRRQVVGGSILVVLGAGLALAAIWNAQNPQGFQTEPPIPWTTLWNMVQAGLALAAAACLYLGIRLTSDRTIERVVLIVGGIALAALFTFVAIRGSAAFIGDSAMRIVWQLLQCAAPTFVILVGARQIFGRKAGMVMIHAGIAILMLNEIYTSVFTIEQRVQFFEGETVNHAIDLRHSELAIVDLSDPTHETHAVIPASRLTPNELIQDSALPVDVMVLKYHRNAQVEPLNANAVQSTATAGIGTVSTLRELTPVTGTEEQVDLPGAYVKLFDKETRREIGTYLVAEAINSIEDGRLDDSMFPANVFTLNDKRYHVSLRFKRYYKPYQLTLIDTEKTNYLGTSTARSYSSQFRLDDSETGIDVSEKVWMNNPLRYRNETFYQANYEVRGGRELSELQVVQNSGWMIPYFCCVFVGLGLIMQFGQTLVGYTRKLNQQLRNESKSGYRGSRWVWSLALIPFLLVAWGINKGRSEPAAMREQMNMDALSRIPVVHSGRSKPLDSVARSIVRRSSGYEKVQLSEDRSTRIDAISWFADLLFHGDQYQTYPLFRIDDPHLRNGLHLEPRKGYRYSLEEVRKSESVLQKIYDDAFAKTEGQRTAFDHRAMELAELLAECRELERLLQSEWDGKSLLNLYYWHVLPESTRTRAILVAPLPGANAWGSMHLGIFCQEMVDRAKRLGFTTVSELAQEVVQAEKDVVRDYAIRIQLMQGLVDNDQIRIQAGVQSRLQWQKLVFDRIRNASLDELETMSGSMIANLDANMEEVLAEQAEQIAEDLQQWLGSDDLAKVSIVDCRRFLRMGEAYAAADAVRFNTELDEYLTAVRAKPPIGFTVWRQAWESFYNRFSPYFLATICYLLGFVLTLLSWMVVPYWLNRAASAAILGGWILHVIGIVMSIGISGRAPVTGLYSSFVFVTAVVVGVFLLIERLIQRGFGFGNLLGSLLGVGGLLWVWNIEVKTVDTFAVLVAVLDTNFWLSTHVICVSLGYSATMAAGALGAAYVLGGLLTPKLDYKRRNELTRLIYGTVCFGLLFSFVGTVLGGLWADDSWGRFWGWDPKENGALMIVLWNAVVLHARWGGLVRQRGLAGLAVIGMAVTAWSWEGVNQLGEGLHAYALADANEFRWLCAFWAMTFIIAGLATIPSRLWWSKIDSGKPLASEA